MADHVVWSEQPSRTALRAHVQALGFGQVGLHSPDSPNRHSLHRRKDAAGGNGWILKARV